MEIFKPELWILISVYAILIIILGQYMRYKGIKTASSKVVSNLTMISPFLTLLFAYLMLNETLDIYEIIAVVLILSGMIISKINTDRKNVIKSDKALAGG